MQMNEPDEAKRTRWHRLLGKLLEELLTPVGVSVYTDFPIMSEPPKTDILLLTKDGRGWSEAQKERLPDGIRDSSAKHILVELKYTESVNDDALRQSLCYEYLYRNIHAMQKHEVQLFLLSSKTARNKTLARFEYMQTDKIGVFTSTNPVLAPVPVIFLNDLSDVPHNACVKCFASRKQEKVAAFKMLAGKNIYSFSEPFRRTVKGLLHYWFSVKGEDMQIELTPEKVAELGKLIGVPEIIRLMGEELEDLVLAGLTPEKILSKLSVEERLSGLKPEEVLSGLKPEELLTGLKPEERLSGLKPEERLSGLSVEEIEAYLRNAKKKSDQQI